MIELSVKSVAGLKEVPIRTRLCQSMKTFQDMLKVTTEYLFAGVLSKSDF